MKVTFSQPTEIDIQEFEDTLHNSGCLEGRTKITVKDDEGHEATLFVRDDDVKRLGEDYIRANVTMYYSDSLENWFAKLSENKWWNDTQRCPLKVVPVSFEGIEGGTGREIYKGIESGRYYLRENHYPRERFAKWYVCGKRRIADDGNEARPNLVFVCNEQSERVKYDDWNGVAAYSDSFNVNFGEEEKKKWKDEANA